MAANSTTGSSINSTGRSSSTTLPAGATSSSPKSPFVRPDSWIPAEFSWMAASDVFCIEASINDGDVVEFIATGVLDCSPSVSSRNKAAALAAAGLSAAGGRDSLRGQLEQAVWDRSRLKPHVSWVKAGTKVLAHCHGVFLLPGQKSLCILVGRENPSAPNCWISEALKSTSAALLADHNFIIDAIREEEEREKEKWDALCERDPRLKDYMGALNSAVYPVLTAEALIPFLSRAVVFQPATSAKSDVISASALAQIAASGWAPSRDGTYAGILCGPVGKRARALVSWAPHTGLPSYPEVRWAVQKSLPAALHKPRLDKVDRPTFDATSLESAVLGFDPNAADLKNVFEDLHLDDADFQSRVHDLRTACKAEGFEAIAWFNSYHISTEETWGIYIDARKLDDFALSLLDDFRYQNVRGSQGLAALLAFCLVYAHELFHARVEAVLSWQELNSRQPRYLRYKNKVYDKLRFTPDWLEEALANWSAWAWFTSKDTYNLLTTMTPDLTSAQPAQPSTHEDWVRDIVAGNRPKGLHQVVEAALDLSPPGYREWRLGNETPTWRTFANQLISGLPKGPSRRLSLPLEGAIKGPLPFDLLQSDIPLRFVGAGAIADRLQSHPATFNVPGRRELERALKYFRYILDPSGGKGGHQKWTGPDQRAFIVPTKDPVSRQVFFSFLRHVGIDKKTYVQQIRPNI